MKAEYNIAIEVSEWELRHLIQLHARRIDRIQWLEEAKPEFQQSADRMSALLEILKNAR